MIRKLLAGILAICMFSGQVAFAQKGKDDFRGKSLDILSYKNNDLFSTDSEETPVELSDKKADRYIVKYKDTVENEELKLAKKSNFKIKEVKEINSNGSHKYSRNTKSEQNKYEIIITSENVNRDDFIAEMQKNNKDVIEYIQPDYELSLSAVDTNEQNSGTDISADIEDEIISDTSIENTSKNSIIGEYETTEDIIVAVLDTGIDITHTALADAVWSNPNETEDGTDSDLNGFIDDTCGWDFVNDKTLTYDESQAVDYGHGTHVAGIIASNGTEMQGVCSEAKILPLKVFENGTAYTSNIIEAISYAESMGASIVNCSFGTSEYNLALKEAIESSNMLFVCAAGNNGMNVDETHVYPACYKLDNIISVATTNDRDYVSYFSNYGESVDIVAYGCDILSTMPNNNYGNNTGTSMSAAYITGALSQVIINNNVSAVGAKNIILETADRISTLDGKISNMRRVNINSALDNVVNDEIIQNVQQDYGIGKPVDSKLTSDMSLFAVSSEANRLGITSVQGGGKHTAVLWRGNVYCFGSNDNGELGSKFLEHSDTPEPGYLSLTNVEQISTRSNHNVALKGDGTVWTWGANNYGQLGQGYFDGVRDTALQVQGLTNIVQVASGHQFSLALDANGNVYAWGNNKNGQLGISSDCVAFATPQLVSNLSDITQISAGTYHVLAKKSNNEIYGWGRNSYGSLGENTDSEYLYPVLIDTQSIGNIKEVIAGFECSFFLMENKKVYACGNNDYGQLGDGTKNSRNTLTLLNISDVKSISSQYSTIILKEDGDVYGCGLNGYGQLGQGNTNAYILSLTKIPGNNYIQASAGSHHTLLLDKFTLYAMGLSTKYQCGSYGAYILNPSILYFFSAEILYTKSVSVDYIKNEIELLGHWTNVYDHDSLNLRITMKDSNGNNYYPNYDLVFVDETNFKLRFKLHYPNEGMNAGGYITAVDDSYRLDFSFSYDKSQLINSGYSSTVLSPIEDTFVYQNGSNADTNFSDNSTLGINYTQKENVTTLWGQYSYLKFNLEDIDPEMVKSAKLYVYVDEESDVRSSTRTISVYETDDTWDVDTISWVNGRFGPLSTETLGSFTVTANGTSLQDAGWREIDATDAVVNDDNNLLSVMAKITSTTAHPVKIRSMEYEDQKTRPQLVIETIQEYTWERTSAGGGGAMFSPIINPYDTNMIMMSCDMGGNYFSYDNGESFDMYPSTHRITSMHAASATDIYMVGSAVLKSTDKGKSFEQVYPNPDYPISYRGWERKPYVVIDDRDKAYSYKSITSPFNNSNDIFFVKYDPYPNKNIESGEIEYHCTLMYYDGEETVTELIQYDSDLNKLYAYNNENGDIDLYIFHDNGIIKVDMSKNQDNQLTLQQLNNIYGRAEIKDYTYTNEIAQPIIDGGTNENDFYVIKKDIEDKCGRVYRLNFNGEEIIEEDISNNDLITANIIDISRDGLVMAGYIENTTDAFGNLVRIPGVAIFNETGWKQYTDYQHNIPTLPDRIKLEKYGYIEDRGIYGGTLTGINIYNQQTFMYTTMFGAYITTNGGEGWKQLSNKPYDENGLPYNTQSFVGGVDKYSKSTGLDVTSVTGVTLHKNYPNRIIMNIMDVGGFVSVDGGMKWKQNNFVAGSDKRDARDGENIERYAVKSLTVQQNSYGSLYIPNRDLILSIWNGTNVLPFVEVETYSGKYKTGTVGVSVNGGMSQKALNNILPKDSLPVSIKCFPSREVGEYDIYICCFGHGIYRFHLTKEMLAMNDNELIDALDNGSNWEEITKDGFPPVNAVGRGTLSSYMHTIDTVVPGNDENYNMARKKAYLIDYPWIFSDKRFSNPMETDEDTSSGNTISLLSLNSEATTEKASSASYGNNIYTYDIVSDNSKNIYAVVCKPHGLQSGGIYKLAGENIWEEVPLPNDNTTLPSTIAFDKDDDMYVGFVVTEKNEAMPYSWIGGGVYKKENGSTQWQLITDKKLDDTNSILKLVYDKETDRLYICGFTMDLLYYKNNNVHKIEGYTFPSTNNIVIHDNKLYVCTRGNGVWIGTPNK